MLQLKDEPTVLRQDRAVWCAVTEIHTLPEIVYWYPTLVGWFIKRNSKHSWDVLRQNERACRLVSACCCICDLGVMVSFLTGDFSHRQTVLRSSLAVSGEPNHSRGHPSHFPSPSSIFTFTTPICPHRPVCPFQTAHETWGQCSVFTKRTGAGTTLDTGEPPSNQTPTLDGAGLNHFWENEKSLVVNRYFF